MTNEAWAIVIMSAVFLIVIGLMVDAMLQGHKFNHD